MMEWNVEFHPIWAGVMLCIAFEFGLVGAWCAIMALFEINRLKQRLQKLERYLGFERP